jgi:hypothetical protein
MRRTLAGIFLIPSLWISLAHAQVSGDGTAGTLPVWTGKTTLGNSQITQNGSNVGIGATTAGARLYVISTNANGEAILGNNTSKSQNTMPVGVAGVANGLLGVGVYGQTNTTSGAAIGTVGITVSPSGMGVEGVNDSGTGDGGNASGVLGVFNGTSGTGSGVIGISASPSGSGVWGQSINNIGVSGTTSGSAGISGYFDNSAAGNLLVGAVKGVHKFRVDGTGKGFFDGGTQTGGADFAESVAVASGERREPGDLMVVDRRSTRQLTLATEPYSTLVAGIYSTKPGVLATPHLMAESVANEIPLAIVGIVPCKVSAENGPILPGDLLVTSATPGHAMKGTERGRMLGAVVGKALEPLSAGKGVIQVLVTLQ